MINKEKIALMLRKVWHEIDNSKIDEVAIEPILTDIDKIIVAINKLH